MSTEPVEQYWDLYSYTSSDPINMIDPDGKFGVRVYRAGRDYCVETDSWKPAIRYHIVSHTIQERANSAVGNTLVGRFVGIPGKIVSYFRSVFNFGTKQIFSKEVNALATKNPIEIHEIDSQLIEKYGE